MNEKIKELALKSYNNVGQPIPKDLSNFMSVYLANFAELIVRECARVGEETDGNSNVKKEILKEFGIK